MPVQRIDVMGNLIGSPQQPMQTPYSPTMPMPNFRSTPSPGLSFEDMMNRSEPRMTPAQTQQMPQYPQPQVATQPTYTTQPQEPSFLQNVGRTAGDFGKGLASSAGGTILGLGGMFGRAIMPESMEQKFGITKESEDELRQMLKDWRGDSFASKAGEFVGEAAQFLAPTGLVGGAAKGVQLLRGAKAVQQVPKIKKTLDVTSKALDLAQKTKTGRFATGGLVTAGQEKVITGETSPITALTGGLFDIKKTKAVKGLKSGLEQKAESQLARLIKPQKRHYEFGADPLKPFKKFKITGNTYQEVENKLLSQQDQIGKEIGDKIKSSKVTFNFQSLSDTFDKLKTEARQQAEGGKESYLNKLEKGWKYYKKEKLGNSNVLNPQQWHDFIKFYEKKINFKSQESAEKGRSEVLRALTKDARDQLVSKIPGVKSLNKDYQNLTQAIDAISAREKVIKRNETTLPQVLGSLVGMGAVGQASENVLMSALGGYTAYQATQALTNALRSPKTRTSMAQAYLKLDKASKSKLLKKLKPQARKLLLNAVSNLNNK